MDEDNDGYAVYLWAMMDDLQNEIDEKDEIIYKLQKEVEVKDKVIHLMAIELNPKQKDEWCKLLMKDNVMCDSEDTCIECLKRYFYEKVGGEK